MAFDFALKPGENQWQYKWRVYQAKADGLIDLDWNDLSAMIDRVLRPDDPPFNECVYRKEAATLNKFWDAVFSKVDMTPAGEAEADLLYKAKQQLADQRREYRALLRRDARADRLGEVMLEAVHGMNKDYPLLHTTSVSHSVMNDTEGVLFVSDVHYGMTTDNMWNCYNTEVSRSRLELLTQRAMEVSHYHGLRRLHVVLLGDMIHGACHVSARVASEETTIDQLIHVSELLAQMINDLSNAVPEVVVHSTYGNHARVVANKKESIHADNMERVIPWWLRERLANNERVTVEESPYYEFVKLRLFRKNLVAVHGDLDNVRELGTVVNGLFGRTHGEQIDYAVMADKHHQESFEKLGVEGYVVGSLCGADDYANDHRLYSKPSQTLMVFTPMGLLCSYPIDLS